MNNHEPYFHQQSQHLQLQQLNGLRAVIIVTYSLFLMWLIVFIKETPNTSIIACLLSAYTFVGIISFNIAKAGKTISSTHLLVQLFIDVILLFLINYMLGGANNPLTSLLLTPIAIAATTLSWQKGALIAIFGVAAYSLLFKFFVPLDVIAPHHQHHGHISTSPNFHMIGMWVNFIVSTGIISFFIYRVAQNTRQQQQHIRHLQEQISNDEQLLSIATLAANTAHELGTPLNTITLLSESLAETMAGTEHQEDIDDLVSQTLRCQTIIQQLNETAKVNLEETISSCLAEDWLTELIDRWQLLKPNQAFHIEKNFAPETQILKHPNLITTAINLLDNASEAATDHISIDTSCENHFFKFIIRNSSDAYQKLSLQPTLSDKPYGMGIGLYLSKASIQRFGGEINIFNESENIVITELSIPLVEDV